MLLGGVPLLVSAWRRAPRVRFLLGLPFIALLIILIVPLIHPVADALLALLTLTPLGPYFGPIVLNLVVYPLSSALLFHRALQRAELSSTVLRFASWLSFVVVGALVLLVVGAVLFSLSFVLAALMSWSDFLPFLLVMCLAVIVAVHALFRVSPCKPVRKTFLLLTLTPLKSRQGIGNDL